MLELMFVIPIISKSPENTEILKIKNKVRESSLTDVVFISTNTVVCADRQDKMLYLVEFNIDKKTSKILSKLKMPYNPELIDAANNFIYIVNLNQLVTVYTVHNKSKLALHRYYDLGSNYTYHGICVNPYNKDQLFLTGTKNKKVLSIFSTNTSTHIDIAPPGLENSNIKDVAFIDSNNIIIIASDGVPKNANAGINTYKSYINLYNYSNNKLALLDSLTYDNCHVDSVIFTKGKYYVTSQLEDKGYLLNGNIEMNYLIPSTHISTDDFPHGLAAHINQLAYTCYSTSSLYIKAN